MIDKTEIDVPLLRKSLEYVTAHPEDWHQQFWLTKSLLWDGRKYTNDAAEALWANLADQGRLGEATWCGTTACLAGTVALTILGGEPVFGERAILSSEVKMPDGTKLTAKQAAVKALGLTGEQADYLFWSTNTLADLWSLANEFTDGEIEVPLQFR